MSPERPSAERGRPRTAWTLVAASALVLATLVAWQSRQGARYRKADMTRAATELAREGVRATPGYRMLVAEAAFTPGEDRGPEGEGLLLRVVVEAENGARAPEPALRAAIRRRVEAGLEDVEAFVALTVIDDRYR